MREPEDQGLSVAYCPLMGYDALQKYETIDRAQTTCDRVDCRRCDFMGRMMTRFPQTLWVCWECGQHYDTHIGFWISGTCARCGRAGNIVLQLVEDRPEMAAAIRRMHEAVTEHVSEQELWEQELECAEY